MTAFETTDGNVTRRTFLRNTALLGLALSGSQWAVMAAAQETPVAGGTLTYNLTGDPPNFDPISNTTSSLLLVIGPCYNGLVVFDPQNPDDIIGDLAHSWELAPDGLSLTFNLVEGVTFHDGMPMTSADVKATFDIVRNPPEGTPSPRRAVLSAVDRIETPDDLTVKFVLKYPSASLLANLAGGWMVVLPKHVLEAEGHMRDVVVGTGPFKFESYTRGVSVALVRNPNYFKAGLPYLDRLEAYVIPSAGTAVDYVKAGQLHILGAPIGPDVTQLQAAPNVNVLERPGTSYAAVFFNTVRAPFDNIELRRAATLAIDREAALKVTGFGHGGIGGAMLPGHWALPAEELEAISGYGRDVEANRKEAIAILEREGFANGLKVKLIVRRIAMIEPLGVFIKDQWARVGIDVEIDMHETASYVEKVKEGNFDAEAGGGSYPLNDPDAMLPSTISCDDVSAVRTCDTELEMLFQRQAQTLDPEERRLLVNQIEVAALKRYNAAYMYWRMRFMAASTKLHNLALHSNPDNNLRREILWLEA